LELAAHRLQCHCCFRGLLDDRLDVGGSDV
jgi:hypothetical protein